MRPEAVAELRAVRERDVVSAVRAQLVEQVRAGMFRTGDTLPPERVLAARLEVSRASLRAAVAGLVDAGLLEPATGRSGPRVRSQIVPAELWPQTALPEADELFSLLETRRAIEPDIARLAAARASDAALQTLEDAIEEQRAHGEDRARAVQAEGRFHRILWRLAANPPLEEAMRTVYLRLEPVLDMAMRTPDDVRASLAVHEHTLAALRGGDDTRIAAAMDEHLALLERIYQDVTGRSFARRSPLAGAGRPAGREPAS
jgi:GntR family transcriptional regulator, transcriptional repressor for pyruvate dehydrogenase complex